MSELPALSKDEVFKLQEMLETDHDNFPSLMKIGAAELREISERVMKRMSDGDIYGRETFALSPEEVATELNSTNYPMTSETHCYVFFDREKKLVSMYWLPTRAYEELETTPEKIPAKVEEYMKLREMQRKIAKKAQVFDDLVPGDYLENYNEKMAILERIHEKLEKRNYYRSDDMTMVFIPHSVSQYSDYSFITDSFKDLSVSVIPQSDSLKILFRKK